MAGRLADTCRCHSISSSRPAKSSCSGVGALPPSRPGPSSSLLQETGWYDGQVWVKTPQMLMRDRLMSSYTVKPAVQRLKRTLIGLGGELWGAWGCERATPEQGLRHCWRAEQAGRSGFYMRADNRFDQPATFCFALDTGALVASVVVLAAAPAPKAYSRPVTYEPPRSSSSVAAEVEDYSTRVQRYEPWALEEDADAVVAAPDLRSHDDE